MADAARGHLKIAVPAIVAAELYYIGRKHRQPQAILGILHRVLAANTEYEPVDFSAREVLDFDRDQLVPEMHDRIVVGVAIRLGLPLITKDEQIVAAGAVKTIW